MVLLSPQGFPARNKPIEVKFQGSLRLCVFIFTVLWNQRQIRIQILTNSLQGVYCEPAGIPKNVPMVKAESFENLSDLPRESQRYLCYVFLLLTDLSMLLAVMVLKFSCSGFSDAKLGKLRKLGFPALSEEKTSNKSPYFDSTYSKSQLDHRLNILLPTKNREM